MQKTDAHRNFMCLDGAVIVLLLAPQLNRWLGKNGLIACERLMAMLLVMLAIQRLMEGLTQFIHTPASS